MPTIEVPRHRVAIWGTGNMGRAAIRAVLGHPQLELVGLIVNDPNKAGTDAATFVDQDEPTGVLATTDIDAVLHDHIDALAYMASGDIRPMEAVSDMVRALSMGIAVVTPSVYPLYYRPTMDSEIAETIAPGIASGGRLFASGIDPGWANDLLSSIAGAFSANITEIRSQELFNYAEYDQPFAVREIIGFGKPMDYEPFMVMPGVLTSVWASVLHLMAQAFGVELERIDEVVERRPLDRTVDTEMGPFEVGTQGGLRFEVRGWVGGQPQLIIEHVTRIDPDCAPDWPSMPDGKSAHRLIVSGEPKLTISVEAESEGGNRAAGGNATAAHRLIGAIPWLVQAAPGMYNGLDIPLPDPIGRLAKGPIR